MKIFYKHIHGIPFARIVALAVAFLSSAIFASADERYRAPAADIVVFKDGLITKKITYLDTKTIRHNSAKIEGVAQ